MNCDSWKVIAPLWARSEVVACLFILLCIQVCDSSRPTFPPGQCLYCWKSKPLPEHVGRTFTSLTLSENNGRPGLMQVERVGMCGIWKGFPLASHAGLPSNASHGSCHVTVPTDGTHQVLPHSHKYVRWYLDGKMQIVELCFDSWAAKDSICG